jgi:hypothetical protein
MGNEGEQDTWLGNTLRRSPATASDACLDAETLAAWADGGLNAKAASAVELHASNCSRCMAVLATMERTAPAAAVTETWTLARVFRWVAPLAAAATAVAIWVAVPQRPIAPVETTISQDLKSAEQVPVPVPGTGSVAELGTSNQNAAPGARGLQEQVQLRDEFRRERAEPQALGSVAAPAPNAGVAPAPVAPSAPTAPFAPEPSAEALARADAPQTAAPAPGPAPAPPAQNFAADAVTESATAARSQRSALSSATVLTSESPAPGNPLIRWRILANTLLERSRDGGKSWTRATGPAQNLAAVRAVDADRAVVRTSDKAEFYTTNGGQSWTRVQENSAAPF